MTSRPARVDAIDFVKGVLVIAMVVYHTLNYVGYTTIPRAHLGFVPLSFIMITGFLVMHVYSRPDRWAAGGIAGRLMLRALKLLAIFTILNVAAALVFSRNRYGVELGPLSFFRNWFDVYVMVESPGVAFDVLVPIAYTIIVAIPVIALRQRWPALVTWLTVCVLALCLVLDVRSTSINSLHFMSAGVLGLWFGERGLDDVGRGANSWLLVSVLAFGYVALAMAGALNYPAQIYMTVVALMVLYSIGCRLPENSGSFAQVCLLGRYSLLSYIVQIFLLQATGVVGQIQSLEQWTQAVVLTVVVTVLMWLAIVVADVLRGRMPIVDRLYRSVFA